MNIFIHMHIICTHNTNISMLPDLLPAHKSGVGVGWGGVVWVITYMTRCCYLRLHFSHIRHATLLHRGGVGAVWGGVGNNVHATLLLSSLVIPYIGHATLLQWGGVGVGWGG